MESELAQAGFDLVHAFDASSMVGEPGLAELDKAIEALPPRRRLGLLVGNTKALWPMFIAAVRADDDLARAAHPLERYTERAIDHAVGKLPHARWWYGHRRYGGAFLPFQRIAVATALGTLAHTHLVIHPTYGPWFALRALVICEGDPPTTKLAARACTCGEPCETALAAALAARGPGGWRAWLAVRDACPVGRAFRYSDDQIAYHYAGDRTVLFPDRD